MKKFHVLYRLTDDLIYSRGENFEANSPVDAYLEFIGKYPNAIFICLYDLDELSHMRLGR